MTPVLVRPRLLPSWVRSLVVLRVIAGFCESVLSVVIAPELVTPRTPVLEIVLFAPVMLMPVPAVYVVLVSVSTTC